MSDIPQLTGPSVLPQDGRTLQQLIIFCHGYGANGADLISLAYPWREVLPDAAFFSPDAPERVPGHPIGYQWWGIGTMSAEERAEGVAQAAPILDAYIEERLEETGLDASRLALVGFSQGTMMALHVGLTRAQTPAVIVGYSGAIADAKGLADGIAGKPPVLLVHGDQDPMIPFEMLQSSAEFLRDQGLAVKTHVSRGVGHGIGPDGVKVGMEFVADAFNGQV